MGAVSAQTEGIRLLMPALAYHRGLVQPSVLSTGSLSDAMPFLIQILARQSDALDFASQQLNASADEVWKATVTYFKFVCFSDTKDAHRVLGLDPWSTPEQIKERYRQLIRLFHPDRGLLFQLDQEQDFAAHINNAYEVLTKDVSVDIPESVALKPKHAWQYKPAMESAPGKQMPKQSHLAGLVSSLGLYKLSPGLIWLLLTLFAVIFVAERYWHSLHSNQLLDDWNQPGQLIALQPKVEFDSGNYAAAVPVESAGIKPLPPEIEIPADAANAMVQKDSGIRDDTLPAIAGNVKPEAKQLRAVTPAMTANASSRPALGEAAVKGSADYKQVQQPPLAIKSDGSAMGTSAKTQVATIQPVPLVTASSATSSSSSTSSSTSAAALDQKPKVATVEASIDTKAADSQEVPAAKSNYKYARLIQALPVRDEPTEAELETLMQHFVTSYNQGNIESFMQLLDEGVQTDEPGGKAGLRAAYARLFSKSQLRQMQLTTLKLQHQGSALLVTTDYQVSVLMTGNSEPKLYRGSLGLEVARIEATPRIVGFYNFPERSER